METGTQTIEGYALSPQQRRLWQVQQAVGADAFRCAFIISLEGPLDRRRLRAALDTVIARHEILRTTFRYVPSLLLPVQAVAPVSSESLFVIHEVDLQELTAAMTANLIIRLFQAPGGSASDDLRRMPLKAALLTIDAERHELFLSLPALCADSSTAGILTAEIAAAYGVGGINRPSKAEEFQYAQFGHWQNELMDSQDGQSARDFWQSRSFPLPVIPLRDAAPAEAGRPTSRMPVRGAGDLFRPRRITFEIKSEIVSFLEHTAREKQTTCSNILLAAWQLLLRRLGVDSRGVVGCEMDARKYAELETMPGLLSQCVPIQAFHSRDLTFMDLIRQVDAAVAEAHEWQEGFRFETEDAESSERAGLKFFPVCFAFQDTSGRFLSEGVRFSVGPLQSVSELFNLRLSIQREDTRLHASLDFNPAVLSEASGWLFAECFQALLRSVARDPNSRGQRLNLLSEGMRHELLLTRSGTASDSGSESGVAPLVQQLFEAQVVRTPVNTAVQCEEQQLNYTELNARADVVAQRLRSLGVGPEVVVAILLEHSVELIVGILGVLKAGGAYLPLDTLYPSARLDFMLADTQAAVLLTHQRLANGIAPSGTKIIYLDELNADAAEPGNQSNRQPLPDNLAYVIYTSGSTGQPKGAMVSHRGLSNYLRWCVGAYGVDRGEGAPLHSSIAFDLSITSLFAPLLTGRCVFVTPAREPGAEALANLLQARENFSFIKLTPAHAVLLGEQLTKTAVAASARVMILGGEALTAQHLAYWRQHAPEMTIVNEYGPTETVVGCCVYQANEAELTNGAGSIPIGKPIVNTQVYVLDEEMEPVPMTVEGELYIGGAGLARGYWQRADLTAERFMPHPFGRAGGERLYRTGDRVKWRSDGELEFVGRLDDQVKLRGYRIELGEIETALSKVPGVSAAVVIVREEKAGDQRLIAYVARVSDGESLEASQLQAALKEELPVYMIPSQFVVLDSLPLTANGKLDRKALLALETAVSQTKEFEAPSSPMEETLCTIFSEVLQREQVSVTADFFELGGHSLLATQVISRVNCAFAVEIPIRTLFERATVRKLAEALQSLTQNEQKGSRPPIKRLPRANRPPTSPQP